MKERDVENSEIKDGILAALFMGIATFIFLVSFDSLFFSISWIILGVIGCIIVKIKIFTDASLILLVLLACAYCILTFIVSIMLYWFLIDRPFTRFDKINK